MTPGRVSWQPYPGVPGVTAGVPAVTAITNANYSQQPHWYYNFLYEEERNRGLDFEEDLAAPGVFEWNFANEKAALVLTTRDYADANLSAGIRPLELLNGRRDREQQRREKFPSRLQRAADAYFVQRHALPLTVPSPPLYLFSPVGTSRCIGPRTVPVRSGLSGAQTADFSRPLLTSDALRTGTVRGPFARAATTLNRYPPLGERVPEGRVRGVASEAMVPSRTIIAG